MKLLDWFRRLSQTPTGDVKPAPDEPEARCEKEQTPGSLLVAEIRRSPPSSYKPEDTDAGRRILDAPPEVQAQALRAAFASMVDVNFYSAEFGTLRALANRLLNRRLPVAASDLRRLLACGTRICGRSYYHPVSLVGLAERFVEETGDADGIEGEARALAEVLHRKPEADDRRLADRLMALVSPTGRVSLDNADLWAVEIQEQIAAMDGPICDAWEALLHLGWEASSGQPTKKWLIAARGHLEEIGALAFRGQVIEWFRRIRPDPPPVVAHVGFRPPLESSEGAGGIADRNATCLRGLVWVASQMEDADLASAVADLGLVCFKKIAGTGPYSLKLGNACVFALGAMPGTDGLAQLGRLRHKIKYPQVQGLISKTYETAAKRLGLTAEDLEELVVPTFGLRADGLLELPLGEHVAELRIIGSTSTELKWRNKHGRRHKTVPTEIKRSHPAELKELKRRAKDIEAQLRAQRHRLERLLLSERTLSPADWRERYLEQPLLRGLVSRLIWAFEQDDRRELAVPRGEELVGLDDRPLAPQGTPARVRLWHPIRSETAVVEGWREWLVAREISQPFKQAHREIYALTGEERDAGRYSSRFAGHILRQHQFHALCRERGWRYELQGQWSNYSHDTPTLELSDRGLRIEFRLAVAQREVADSGIYLYLTSDQVRFYRRADGDEGPGELLPLTEVPELVFSEVMRDVDMLTSVTSIAADPSWQDHGDEQFLDYCEGWAFGELGAAARQRRGVLKALLPKLKFADRCSIQDRFLVVRGKLGTYKIHLGSGYVRLEHNDAFLHIVPERSRSARRDSAAAAGVTLPFEDDYVLYLILAKAVALAEDDKITDPEVRQRIGA